MQLWKPLLIVVPAGLLIGTLAGQATRPVPLIKEERPWPESVRESANRIEPWRPIYEGGPRDLDPPGYSYRPDLDYEAFAWPDHADYSAELLADDRSGRPSALEARYGPVPELPLTRRAEAELVAARASAALADADATRAPATHLAPTAEDASIVLPPVPPPLARASDSPGSAEAGAIEAF